MNSKTAGDLTHAPLSGESGKVDLKHSSTRANRDPSLEPEPGGVSEAQTTLQTGVPEVEK
jgi:hypothetical protein